MEEIGVEEEATVGEEVMGKLVHALYLVAVAQVVQGLHGDYGVDRVCDLCGPAVSVEVGVEEGDAIFVRGQAFAGTFDEWFGEVDAGVSGGEGAQELVGELAAAGGQFDHVGVEGG